MRRFLSALALASALVVPLLGNVPAAHAASSPLRWIRGYSIQGSWLCYGWANGSWRCTQHHRGYTSLNPSWVPNGLSATQSAPAQPATYKPASDPYPYGQCTYGAYLLAGDNVGGLHNAKDWLANARAKGLPTGVTPRVGATVVYQPGVQGASALGHVAHVIAVYANGSFLVREMNYYGFGGGFGQWSTRVSHSGWGVGFIY